jgi:hypothetical protein
VTAPSYPCSAGRRGARCLSFHALFVLRIGLALAMLTDVAQADNFANVYYDARRDQVVVTIFYRGTNPNHTFPLQWAQCKDLADGSERGIVAEVLESKWQDEARQDFKKTTSFNLADLHCRPAKLTLKTAPRFYYTLRIPGLNDRRP